MRKLICIKLFRTLVACCGRRCVRGHEKIDRVLWTLHTDAAIAPKAYPGNLLCILRTIVIYFCREMKIRSNDAQFQIDYGTRCCATFRRVKDFYNGDLSASNKEKKLWDMNSRGWLKVTVMDRNPTRDSSFKKAISNEELFQVVKPAPDTKWGEVEGQVSFWALFERTMYHTCISSFYSSYFNVLKRKCTPE